MRGILFLSLVHLFCSCGNSEPLQEERFFQEAAPDEFNLTVGFLDSLSEKAKSLPNIYSFLIVKDEALVLEKYYNGAGRESLLHISSITKSISALMVGIALRSGDLSGVNEKVATYFEDYSLENRKDYLAEINIDHILHMQTGFDWNETREAITWYTTISDSWGYLFGKEVGVKPGTEFNYNSGAVSLLSRVLERVQPLSYESYGSVHLFEPLGIERVAWEQDGLGNTRADAGLQLRAIDLAKIGYVAMQEGVHDGREVVPASWMQDSWEFDLNLSSDYGPINDLHYNNLWWMGKYKEREVFFGLGYGGQLLVCVPECELIVVTNHEFRLPGATVASHSQRFLNELFVPIMDRLLAI